MRLHTKGVLTFLLPLTAICAWILLGKRLTAPGDPKPATDRNRRTHAA